MPITVAIGNKTINTLFNYSQASAAETANPTAGFTSQTSLPYYGYGSRIRAGNSLLSCQPFIQLAPCCLGHHLARHLSVIESIMPVCRTSPALLCLLPRLDQFCPGLLRASSRLYSAPYLKEDIKMVFGTVLCDARGEPTDETVNDHFSAES